MMAMRAIVHLDVDSFFVQCELRARGALGDLHRLPVAVDQYFDLIAINDVGKRAGLAKHMHPAEAAKVAPSLRVYHVTLESTGKATYKLYRETSRQLFASIRSFCPVFEKASIDECYLDISALIASSSSLASVGFWSTASSLVDRLRASLKAEHGIEVSAGVSFSKSFAKLASRRAKPNGQLVVSPADAPAFLAKAKPWDLPGFGGVHRAGLEQLDVASVQALAGMSPDRLSTVFDDVTARLLVDIARGVNDDHVVDKGPPQSISAVMSLSVGCLKEFMLRGKTSEQFPLAASDVETLLPYLSSVFLDVNERISADALEWERYPQTLTMWASFTDDTHGSRSVRYPSQSTTEATQGRLLAAAWTALVRSVARDASAHVTRISVAATRFASTGDASVMENFVLKRARLEEEQPLPHRGDDDDDPDDLDDHQDRSRDEIRRLKLSVLDALDLDFG